MKAENMRNYRDKLVEAVQSVGKELINRADEIVGHKDMTTGFNISIDIDSETGTCIPTITVTQSYISESVLKM